MRYLRYKGEFVTIAGHVIRAEIWQEAEAPFFSIGDLTFDADSPIEIEWGEQAKEEVICGSTATLHIISPGDRTYEDLYTIAPGDIRLDIYRDEELYWSGCIDTEFYEEPYEQEKGYTVELTFSDFGILKRLNYDLSGMLTMGSLLHYALNRSRLNYIFRDTSMISTTLHENGTQMRLEDIKVRSENFYDEDGEAATLHDAIEGMMQPLGLRMIQRNGTIYVYDLNGLYWRAGTREIYWNGEEQQMGADKVYNNAKITWSTYAQSGNLLPERAWGFVKTDKNLTALDVLEGKSYPQGANTVYYSYHCGTDARYWLDDTDAGFTLWTSLDGENVERYGHTRYFKTVTQNDGSETEGVALFWTSYKREGTEEDYWVREMFHGEDKGLLSLGMGHYGTLMKMHDAWLPPVSENAAKGLILRLSLNLLLDPRFNPYESAAKIVGRDEQKYCDRIDAKANFVYVPVLLKYTDNGTGKVYVWDNRDVITQDVKKPVTTMSATLGKWVPYSEEGGRPTAWGYLAYYDAKDRATKSGITGWKENRPAINPHREKLTSLLEKSEAGQFIPFPNLSPDGGKLSISILSGLWQMATSGATMPLHLWDGGDYNIHVAEWDMLRWVLCELPKLEILNAERYDREINTDDVEYSATLNASAEEGIDIDTIFGTAKEGVPTARGAYFNAHDGKQITEFTREGRTGQAEDLLIGTLYSQYATRHTVLSGEANLLHTRLYAYTEQNQEGKKFICVSDVQDLRLETSEATFVELSKDEYKNQEGI